MPTSGTSGRSVDRAKPTAPRPPSPANALNRGSLEAPHRSGQAVDREPAVPANFAQAVDAGGILHAVLALEPFAREAVLEPQRVGGIGSLHGQLEAHSSTPRRQERRQAERRVRIDADAARRRLETGGNPAIEV